MRIVILLLAFPFGLSACGQKGALYLPENAPAGHRTDTYQPVPYPERPAGEEDVRQ
jgi:predicted small lipoprotein YifL